MNTAQNASAPDTSFDTSAYKAYLFDLDGVVTPTAEVHMRAWARMFNDFLKNYDDQGEYTDQDYFEYVDGKPRYDGVASFLESRGISIPKGDPSDDASKDTVCGLGNRKNDLVLDILENEGVKPYPGTIEFLDSLPEGTKLAIVSSSKNAPNVLKAAGVFERFEYIVDGNVASEQNLAGKPAPDTYLYGAKLLGCTAEESVVLEDATSGVKAGAAGDFGAVIGVDRGVGHDALYAAGATIVVNDLGELA